MTIARPLLAAGTTVCLGGALFTGMGGVQGIARAGGEASLEFVGDLIGNVRDIRLDRLDPTYPHCF